MMKICKRCDVNKPLEEYYKHSRMADGHLNFCKECVKKRVTKHRDENVERIREYDRVRNKENGRDSGPKKLKRTREYRARFPVKHKAQEMVNNAVRDKRLFKSDTCECCGIKKSRIIGHHDDYAKPLEVRWLCQVCHSAWHKEHGEALNPS